MTTLERASTTRGSLLLKIVLSPFRAIENTHGWRRLGVLIGYVLIAFAIGAFLWRQTRIASLPDVGEPFDTAAYRSAARVPDDRNAFVLYRQAALHYRQMTNAEGESFSNANFEWSRSDAIFRSWVDRARRRDRASGRGLGAAGGFTGDAGRRRENGCGDRLERPDCANWLDRHRGPLQGRSATGRRRPGKRLGFATRRGAGRPARRASSADAGRSDPGPDVRTVRPRLRLQPGRKTRRFRSSSSGRHLTTLWPRTL